MTRSIPLFVLMLALLALACAEIKEVKLSDDPRPLILFERFAFTADGLADVDVAVATFSSTSVPADPTDVGFVLVPDYALVMLELDRQQSLESNPSDTGPSPPCILSSPHIRLLFTLRDLTPPPFNSYNRSFSVAAPGDYALFLVNCVPDGSVSISVRTALYNQPPGRARDYLPAGQAPVPAVCFLFSLAYVVFLVVWVQVGLLQNKNSAHRIHYLMAALLAAKALNLFFRAEDQHYVQTMGTPRGWDVLFYLFQFIKGILLFTVIVLIGTGWSFFKPFLQDREKKVLMVVLPLQVINNLASIVMVENGPFGQDWETWIQVFVLVDVVCCFAILLPVMWSIRSLREGARSDGKAARILEKLVLFRRFYLVLVGYLYFTRVAVHALTLFVSYKNKWVVVVVEEGVRLMFYLSVYYLFRPKTKNGYFALDDQKEAAAMLALEEQFDV